MGNVKQWTRERVKRALEFISPSCSYADWVAVGMALHSEWPDEFGLDVWNEWSSGGDNYQGRKDCEQKWKGFNSGGGRTMGYIHAVATKNGWRDTSISEFVDPAIAKMQTQAREEAAKRFIEEDAKKHAEAARKAEEIWNAAVPASDDHCYLIRKKIKAQGCRIGTWHVFDSETGQHRIVTEKALLVPIKDHAGKLWGLQAIFPAKDEKLARDRDYLRGIKKTGNFFGLTSGKKMPHNGRPVFILAEGFATAVSIFEATERRVLACMDASNLASVAAVIRGRLPEALIVIAADHDDNAAGEKAAQRAIEAAGGRFAAYVMPEACPGDFSDLWVADRAELIIRHINDAIERASDSVPLAVDLAVTGLSAGNVLDASEAVAEAPKHEATCRAGVRENLPTINLCEGDRARIVKELASALAVGGLYYRRDMLLVRAITLPADDESGGVWRSRGSVVLRPASPQAVVADASRFAKTVKFDARSKQSEPKDLPDGVASAFCVLGVEQQVLPSIIGVVRCPILREDGSLHVHCGYDPATKLILAGTEDWALLNVPERPTIDDARDALQYLLDGPFADFPFVDDASCSVAVSSLLTAVLRPVIPCAPLHGFSAPQFGAGKSLQAEFAAIVATGAKPSMIAPGHSQEEFEKRVDTALIEGDQVVVLDNLSRPLTGDNLCASLTSDTAKVRRLGSSQSVTVPTSAFWMATGMNLSVTRDMHRRTVISYIDAGTANPEARSVFKIANLKEWAAKNRMNVLSAVYTMLRAHAQAGYPSCGEVQLGNFEVWSRRVAHCLVWLGMVNPVRSQDRLRADDPEYQNRVALMRALYRWQERRKTSGRSASWTIKDLHDAVALGGEAELSEAISAAVHNGIHGAKYWTRSNKNVTVNDGDVDYKLTNPSSAAGGVARWKVEAVKNGQTPKAAFDESPI